MIGILISYYFAKEVYDSESINNIMIATRLMAIETRYERNLIVKSFQEVINSNVRSIIYFSKGYNHIIYVFLSSNNFNSDKEKLDELELRCITSAYLMNKEAEVIGISWENLSNGDSTFDIVYHNYKEMWNSKFDQKAKFIIEELGYFKNISL